VNGLGLAAWLTVGAAFFCWGVLAAMTGRRRGGTPAGVVLMLAGTGVTLAAFVQYGVLSVSAVSCFLLALILGSILVLIAMVMDGREASR